MTEKLLQFLWRFQYFNKVDLRTTTGEAIKIIHAGTLNNNSGPDFLEAKIKIGDATLAGSVELHLKTSDWQKHRHDEDANYKNVVLHVVYVHDDNNTNLPVLELQNHIPKILLERFESLMNETSFIPCANNISDVKPLTWLAWKERLVAERLTRKAAIILEKFEHSNHHWEETFWWLLAKNFGSSVNAEAFEAMAQSLPINILAKNKQNLLQLEALLLGQAGLLNQNFKDDYPKSLQKEYNYLKEKYSLTGMQVPVHFMRMRPVNFPTVRLAQLATLVHRSQHLFSKILEAGSVKNVKALLSVAASEYWHTHYRFDELSDFKPKNLGADMIDTIIINTVVPTLFAYGKLKRDEAYQRKALQWLEETKLEKNNIVNGFTKLQVGSRNAYDTQAMIELKNEYCNHKNCLQCTVGNALLKTNFTSST